MASDTKSDDAGRALPTIDPEIEPEYVGAHSAVEKSECVNWLGETLDELEPCDSQATHTVVMKSEGGLHEIAMCDDCGEPQDATASGRKWSA